MTKIISTAICKALNPSHSGAETLMLDALDGKETLVNATKVFSSGIDGNFKEWNTDKPGIATKEQTVDVHELVKDATFAQMFGSLGTDLDKLCLTQAQIINFCKKYPKWLHQDGYAIFFLFKVEDQFFVACVFSTSYHLGAAYMFPFETIKVWPAWFSYCLVVPQLTD